ncbi:hypothetical protein, partial [Proteus terrae]|uniref:hypothetical protein n=1 Tax=Proteus terrae TaxID=1574161 RepID=UPI00301DA9CE
LMANLMASLNVMPSSIAISFIKFSNSSMLFPYLAVTPNSLLGCFVLTPENINTSGKQQLSGDD